MFNSVVVKFLYFCLKFVFLKIIYSNSLSALKSCLNKTSIDIQFESSKNWSRSPVVKAIRNGVMA